MRIDVRWLVAIAIVAAAVVWASREGPQTSVAADTGGEITIDVTPGEHWLRGTPGQEADSLKVGPQIAVWLEDSDGAFVATIFVTRRAATEDWVGVPGAPEGVAVTPRPLPVWVAKHRGIGVEPMAACGACHGKRRSEDKSIEGDPILEALVGPSPAAGLTREWQLLQGIEPGVYGVMVEINHWMDWNEAYPGKAAAGGTASGGGPIGSGQPSLVWGGALEVGPTPEATGLTLIGHGDPTAADGSIDPDLTGFTTALSIVDTIDVAYAPPK
jgi:hypothetical protein